jgi:hypothetical protein
MKLFLLRKFQIGQQSICKKGNHTCPDPFHKTSADGATVTTCEVQWVNWVADEKYYLVPERSKNPAVELRKQAKRDLEVAIRSYIQSLSGK